MKEYNEDEFLLLSGIQHYVFCKRQWALIHIEQQWSENLRTIEGKIMHENAHDGMIREKRKDVVTSRGMMVFSKSLGITGACDVVEFHKSSTGVKIFSNDDKYEIVPIEYKKGKPKKDESDILQLCAEAMCIEEMVMCDIPVGYLYYGEIRRRVEIELNNELRDKVKKIFSEMHELYAKKYTPKVKISKACKACSISNICIPQLCKNTNVEDYINARIEEV